METNTMEAVASNIQHKVVTPQEWLEARKQLLQKEKELARVHNYSLKVNQNVKNRHWSSCEAARCQQSHCQIHFK